MGRGQKSNCAVKRKLCWFAGGVSRLCQCKPIWPARLIALSLSYFLSFFLSFSLMKTKNLSIRVLSSSSPPKLGFWGFDSMISAAKLSSPPPLSPLPFR